MRLFSKNWKWDFSQKVKMRLLVLVGLLSIARIVQYAICVNHKLLITIYCPEGAFCVGRLKKKGVCSSVRPPVRTPSVPCALATNQQILGKNLQIRGFSVNFDLNHQKLKTCVLGEWIRIEEWISWTFLIQNLTCSKYVTITQKYVFKLNQRILGNLWQSIITFGRYVRWRHASVPNTKRSFGATLALRV